MTMRMGASAFSPVAQVIVPVQPVVSMASAPADRPRSALPTVRLALLVRLNRSPKAASIGPLSCRVPVAKVTGDSARLTASPLPSRVPSTLTAPPTPLPV